MDDGEMKDNTRLELPNDKKCQPPERIRSWIYEGISFKYLQVMIQKDHYQIQKSQGAKGYVLVSREEEGADQEHPSSPVAFISTIPSYLAMQS